MELKQVPGNFGNNDTPSGESWMFCILEKTLGQKGNIERVDFQYPTLKKLYCSINGQAGRRISREQSASLHVGSLAGLVRDTMAEQETTYFFGPQGDFNFFLKSITFKILDG